MTSILFIQSSRPHGNIAGQEGLDAIMMGSAFTECGVLFAGDAVLQLVKDQDTAGIATRNYAVTYGALKDYGVGAIYCDGTSLERFNLVLDDLSDAPARVGKVLIALRRGPHAARGGDRAHREH